MRQLRTRLSLMVVLVGVPLLSRPANAQDKSLTEGIGASTAAGAGGAAAVNLLTGIGELTLGVGAVASGAAGAVGTFVCAFLWNVAKRIVDPPQFRRPFTEWWYWLAIILIVLAAIASLGARSANPWARVFGTSIVIGGFIGAVCGFSLVDVAVRPAVMSLTGVVIGIMDVVILRSGRRSILSP